MIFLNRLKKITPYQEIDVEVDGLKLHVKKADGFRNNVTDRRFRIHPADGEESDGGHCTL